MKQLKTPLKTRLKRGDLVQVIAGKSRGSTGKIINVNRKTGQFKVEGLNLQKKHLKPNAQNQRGGIISIEGPIHFSNVLLYSKEAKRGQRIGVKIVDGVKKRIFVKSKAEIDG